ncbi:MAG TPA: putative glycoside hydrolase [bacterium]|nr:putative glycoside hydrolase [bacterium]HPT29584.1 putative glycoside hydrolase [bacterium]
MRQKIIILFLALSLLGGASFASAASIGQANPKTANAFLRWQITDAEVAGLAKFDVLILDMENQAVNPQRLKKIKELHPDIIILAYISSQEIRNDTALYNIPLRQKMFAALPDSWYLRDEAGKKISFWPDTWMINVANSGFDDYLPRFIDEEILSSGLWDGIFFDNLWEDVAWLNGGDVDINGDGRREGTAELNRAWQEGVENILSATRDRVGSKYILLANSSSYLPYHQYLNGRLFEDFPSVYEGRGTWEDNISSYQKIQAVNLSPQIYVFNLTNNESDNFSRRLYGLSSSVLFDNIYFSFDRNISDHGQSWWFKEYDFNLGEPLGAAQELFDETGAKYYRREFRNGLAILNPQAQETTINLETEYRLVGKKAKTKSISVPARSGWLLERVRSLQSSLFSGGTYSGYDLSGKTVATQLVSSKVQKGARTNLINGVGIKGSGAYSRPGVWIYYNQKLVGAFNPYPRLKTAAVLVSLGDYNGDGQLEIATLPAGGQDKLKIFSLRAKLLASFSVENLGKSGKLDLLSEDLNKDEITEIIVGRY